VLTEENVSKELIERLFVTVTVAVTLEHAELDMVEDVVTLTEALFVSEEVTEGDGVPELVTSELLLGEDVPDALEETVFEREPDRVVASEREKDDTAETVVEAVAQGEKETIEEEEKVRVTVEETVRLPDAESVPEVERERDSDTVVHTEASCDTLARGEAEPVGVTLEDSVGDAGNEPVAEMECEMVPEGDELSQPD
jgi:hypothetical protein